MINPVLLLKNNLSKLKEVCVQNNQKLSNEETTKQILIVPFVKALGYNVACADEFKAEYSPKNIHNSFKVDYCITINDKNSIFIEAKAYGKNLYRFIDQMAKYCNGSEEVELGILTNGREFLFFIKNSRGIMNTEPFFIFDLLDYSIDDLEVMVNFSKGLYNYRNMRLIARENRLTNKLTKSLYNILSNPDMMGELFSNEELAEIPSESMARILPIVIERSVLKKSYEIEAEREKQTILRYSEDQLKALGYTEYINEIGHDIFIPTRAKFDALVKTSEEDYSIEKGNPNSDFFVSKIYVDGKETKGFLIGHFDGTFDEDNMENVNIYCFPVNNIEKFVKDNPLVNTLGFINARFQARKNMKSGKTSYYLQSNIAGISFFNFPGLVHDLNDFEEFHKEFFA